MEIRRPTPAVLNRVTQVRPATNGQPADIRIHCSGRPQGEVAA